MSARAAGSALVVGLLLLSLITLLGLVAASASHIDLQLARNDQFRENASAAASAGIESAISHMSAFATDTDFTLDASLPGTGTGRFEVSARMLGTQQGLPQPPGAQLAGALYEIVSNGVAERRAVDRQRVIVMRVFESPVPVMAADCEPAAPGARCLAANTVLRLSWQRLPAP